MFNRESKVRLSDVATLALAFKELFQAGVDAATPGPLPEQFMFTPEQLEAEQKQMEKDAGWIATGDGDGEEED